MKIRQQSSADHAACIRAPRNFRPAALAVAVAALMSACSPSPIESGSPSAADRGACPDIRGYFRPGFDSARSDLLRGARVASSDDPAVSIAGESASSFSIHMSAHDDPTGGTALRTMKHGSDFSCRDGWVQLTRAFEMRLPEEFRPDGRASLSRTISMRKNSAGALEIRTDSFDWEQFSVWCGDGCKGFKIPFSEIHRRWSSTWEPYKRPNSAPRAGAGPSEIAGWLASILPSDSKLASSLSDDSGLTLEFSWTGAFDHTAFEEALSSFDVKASVVRLSRSGSKIIGATLRVDKPAPSPEKLEAAAAFRRRDVLLERMAASFWPKLPRGSSMTNFSFRGSGYAAEARLPDMDAAASMLAKLSDGSPFEEPRIASSDPSPMGGVSVTFELQARSASDKPAP